MILNFTQKQVVLLFAALSLPVWPSIAAAQTTPETKAKLVKSVVTYGDAMGATEGAATKRTDNFYDGENRLLRSISYQLDADKQLVPYGYTKYEYSTNADGNTEVYQVSRLKAAGSGSSSDTDRYWQKYNKNTSEQQVYAPDGKLLQWTKTGNTRTDYTYDGDNLTEEKVVYVTGGSMDGKVKSKVFYSNFVEGQANCPQTVLTGSVYASSVTLAEYEYDDKGHKTQCVTYKTTGAEADEDNVYYEGAEKAAPKSKDIWTYDDQGRLTEHVFYYKYTDGQWVANYNNKRQVYTYDNDTTTMKSFTGDMTDVEKWSPSTTYTRTVEAEYDKTTALARLDVSAKADEAGAYVLSADKPQDTSGYIYMVYRDADPVGQMALDEASGRMVFEDSGVGNGVHDWFVLTEDAVTEAAFNISNAVEVDTEISLNAVTNIKVTANTFADDKYTITVTWSAPQTEDAELLGYNFYTDVVNINTSTPQNGKLITGTEYSFSWAVDGVNEDNKTKTFWVEAVYNLGKVKSDPQQVTLDYAAGIGSLHGGTTPLVPVYTIEGVNTHVDSSHMNSLPKGMYIVGGKKVVKGQTK